MSDLPTIPTFKTAHEMATFRRDVDWLVEGVMPRASFGLLFGDPGAGKSFLALSLSCAVASGLDWQGRAVRAGSVVYLAGEGHGGIGRRMAAWAHHSGASLESLPVWISQYATNFLDPGDMAETIADLKAALESVALIVVDTLARSTPGMNEDRASEMGAFVQSCDNLRADFPDATILVLHHSPHSDKSRAKGSVALKGAVDFEFGLLTTAEDGVVKLTCTKMKDGEAPADMWLRFEGVDLADGQTSAVLVATDEPSARSARSKRIKLTPNDKLLMLCLGADPIEEEAVRAAYKQRHPSKNPETINKSYGRARKRGLDRGWFVEDGTLLIPSTAEMLKDRPDRTPGHEGQ